MRLTLEEAFQGTQRQVAIKSAGHTEAVRSEFPRASRTVPA